MKKRITLKAFFRVIPVEYQSLVFAIVAGFTLDGLIRDLRSEIVYLVHFDSNSTFLIQAGSSIGAVTRPLLTYVLNILTLYFCAFVIRKRLSSSGERSAS